MSQFVNRLKESVSGPIAKTVIALSCASPRLRGCFARARVTPNRFGKKVVPVALGKGRNLLIAGAADVHLSFQLFWVGIDYYEPFTRTVIECLGMRSEFFIDVGANIGFFRSLRPNSIPG